MAGIGNIPTSLIEYHVAFGGGGLKYGLRLKYSKGSMDFPLGGGGGAFAEFMDSRVTTQSQILIRET